MRYEAFVPDEEGVSVTWLEYFKDVRADCLRAVQEVINQTRKVRATHRLAIISVGKVLEIGAEHGATLWVEHDPFATGDPNTENLAHSLIIGIAAENVEMMEALALECEIHLCKIQP